MEIKQGDNRFFIGEETNPEAEITFQPTDNDTIIIDHTYTDPKFRGQGIAKALVLKVTDYAKDNNLKIIPQCSYAQIVMERDEDLKQLIK
ncbi:GNAT family N-acetyltransferase [Macrococcoides caseolyticum]|uniref:GNAT family N-acetyltransferase n=1 Tax=Macrococcoides caseolyticum TaxID=69966 RepID=UPI001F479FCC|nr:GNAT family N-acetyltransferase [Macrococcus caseolyticus]MCE4957452.1 N-acetyltransferase [Macrococcus caseolyticus]